MKIFRARPSFYKFLTARPFQILKGHRDMGPAFLSPSAFAMVKANTGQDDITPVNNIARTENMNR